MSKTRDTGFLANVIQVHDTGVRIMSGSEMLMAISSSGAVTITGELSGSDAANSLLLDGTGSLAFTTTASYNAFSASYGIASASLSSRTTQVERTYATTGSNTFTGAQYISDTSNAIGFTSTASLYSDGGLRVQGNSFVSGTAYFNNIVVYGTSSIQYITSSQVNISTNIITVNTDTPAIRFGGLSVFDSGSTGLTGSILWDSEKNHWVYSNPSGSTYSGGMFISGPRSSALGSEQGTTSCMLLVGQGGDHLTSSMIYHSSTVTCVGTGMSITSGGDTCFASNACALNLISRCNIRVGVNGGYAIISGPTTGAAISLGSNSATFDRNLSLGLMAGDFTFSPVLTINAQTSNVGIGTCTPTGTYGKLSVAGGISILDDNTGKLEIGRYSSGAPNSYIKIGTNSNSLRITNTADNADVFTVTNCGNIGIGTTCPSGTGIALNAKGITGNTVSMVIAESADAGSMVSLYSGASSSDHPSLIYLRDLRIGSGNKDTTGYVERMRITSTGIATFACNICVAKYLTVGSQGGGDIVFLGGGSGVGAAIEARYADGNPNVRFAGNGNSWINRTYGNVGIGTCTPGYMLDVNGAINTTAGTLYSNNVVTYAIGGTMLGTTAAYYDFPAWNDGGQGQMFEIKAFFDHFYNWAYGAHYYVYLTTRETLSQALTMFSCPTGNGGSWMAYKPNTTTLRVCKLAGTYPGGGAYWIQVTAKQP